MDLQLYIYKNIGLQVIIKSVNQSFQIKNVKKIIVSGLVRYFIALRQNMLWLTI